MPCFPELSESNLKLQVDAYDKTLVFNIIILCATPGHHRLVGAYITYTISTVVHSIIFFNLAVKVCTLLPL